MSDTVNIELVYALPEKQWLQTLTLKAGATAREAIEQSGLLNHLSEWTFETGKLGIYSRLVTLDYVLRDRDRIELYRPILIDPKDARRQRAKKKS
jgi:putative ubiquitin-RnfH superfamily antitoxin RatB of RatAB toxin-antitoxin module